jgi:pimeloyl-ACP methyl ester carboxylesterase
MTQTRAQTQAQAPTAAHRFAGLAADLTGTDDNRPPLVLLHGLSFDRTMWRPALAELERIDPGRRVLALDLPGHGDSRDAPQRELEQVMHAVHAAVTEAGLGSPVIAGHSMSAILATFYAASFPCSAVVNVDQTLVVEPFLHLLQGLAGQLRGPGFAAVWATFQESMHPELLPAEGREIVRRTGRSDQDLIVGYWSSALDTPPSVMAGKLAGAVSAIRAAGIPYTFVAGDQGDDALRAWIAEALPHATLTVWPGSGHFPHLARPAAFARILAGHSGPPGGNV